jgi:hypothetical protein
MQKCDVLSYFNAILNFKIIFQGQGRYKHSFLHVEAVNFYYSARFIVSGKLCTAIIVVCGFLL